MAEWRSNLKWTPVILATLAALGALAAVDMLTTPIAIAIVVVGGAAIARF